MVPFAVPVLLSALKRVGVSVYFAVDPGEPVPITFHFFIFKGLVSFLLRSMLVHKEPIRDFLSIGGLSPGGRCFRRSTSFHR